VNRNSQSRFATREQPRSKLSILSRCMAWRENRMECRVLKKDRKERMKRISLA
jgi:hypothetical protein